jgi:SAM-dependent methyltransferase
LNWPWILALILGSLALVAVIYWQLVIAEGAYLGAAVVAKTYDWVAKRYDGIKRFNPRDETWFVAGPVLVGLAGVKNPLVLDVATGTGRVPLALLRTHYLGRIVGLDLSLAMLRQARANLQPYGQVHLLHDDASKLPFADDSFDAVTCLESLEFFPAPLKALAEMVRVLAPGGVLFVTNRVGIAAPLLPGKAIPRPRFEEELAALPLRDIKVQRWQVNYDLAFARKEGVLGLEGHGGLELGGVLRCAGCKGEVERRVASYSCTVCGRTFPIQEGIVHLTGQ